MEHNFNAMIKDRIVKYRKWKVKDRKKFIENKKDPIIIKEALVYDCLDDKNIALSEDEYKYVLFLIRDKSIQEKITYVFECTECEHQHEYSIDLEEVMKSEYKSTKEIQQNGHIFTMSNIKNRNFYETTMNSVHDEEKYIVDFILHVGTYNDEPKTFEQMFDIINNMNVDDFEVIFKTWEDIRFKVNNEHNVICPKCNNSDLYEFDDLPGFFPDSWNV